MFYKFILIMLNFYYLFIVWYILIITNGSQKQVGTAELIISHLTNEEVKIDH